MRVRLIGNAHDVTGFALAGVDSEECHTRAEIVQALEAASRDSAVAVVVSADVAARADDAIRRMRESSNLPMTVVLPGGDAS